MDVKVKLHAVLRRHHPGPNQHLAFAVDIPPASTVADLVPILGLPDELVWAASVNGEAVELDHPLKTDDHISLFPPVAGGRRREDFRRRREI